MLGVRGTHVFLCELVEGANYGDVSCVFEGEVVVEKVFHVFDGEVEEEIHVYHGEMEVVNCVFDGEVEVEVFHVFDGEEEVEGIHVVDGEVEVEGIHVVDGEVVVLVIHVFDGEEEEEGIHAFDGEVEDEGIHVFDDEVVEGIYEHGEVGYDESQDCGGVWDGSSQDWVRGCLACWDCENDQDLAASLPVQDFSL